MDNYYEEKEGNIYTKDGMERLWEEERIVFLGGIHAFRVFFQEDSKPMVELMVMGEDQTFIKDTNPNNIMRFNSLWLDYLISLSMATLEKIEGSSRTIRVKAHVDRPVAKLFTRYFDLINQQCIIDPLGSFVLESINIPQYTKLLTFTAEFPDEDECKATIDVHSGSNFLYTKGYLTTGTDPLIVAETAIRFGFLGEYTFFYNNRNYVVELVSM